MSTDWIKMRVDLREDPAVFRLAKLTKQDRLSVVGRLWAFWSWADKHAINGKIAGADAADVDEIADKRGFASALVDVGWLSIGDGFVAIPKHDRHTGESAKERSLKNARQARWRQSRDTCVDDEASTDVDGEASTSGCGGSSTQASTREEKRREEKNTPKAPKGAGTVHKFPPGFDRFWEAYPKKVGKDDAGKAFAKRKPDAALLDAMLAAIAVQRRSLAWTKDGGQFIPNPSTWLTQGRWQDEVSIAGAERDDMFRERGL